VEAVTLETHDLGLTMKRIIRLMRRHSRRAAVIIVLLGLSGCRPSQEGIRDIRDLVQDNTFYVSKSAADVELVTPSLQRQLNEKFDRSFFSPWHEQKPSISRSALISEFAGFRRTPGYGGDGKRHAEQWLENLWANVDIDNYPSLAFNAINVVHGDLRVLPTGEYYLSEPNVPEGREPFDDFQRTSIPVNTPLYISHASRDGLWLYADSHYGCGWIPAKAVARVDSSFVNRWECLPKAAIVAEDQPVYDRKGDVLFTASLGSRFPSMGDGLSIYKILVAVAGADGDARAIQARVSKNSARCKPMKLTPFNIAEVANKLINKPYGWGGIDGKRDCSQMLKDLFAPFGLWLPRHSSSQAREGGRLLDLSEYSAAEKEELILEKGIPFFTLLWADGHIMLYIGEKSGQPLVFQSFWGVRTKDFWGRKGRKIVGMSAITTLHPGAELPDADPGEDLVNRVKGMTLLGQVPHKG
jgi:hypothetical protein